MSTGLRKIAPVPLHPSVSPAVLDGALPRFEWIGLDRLIVDAAYQRDLSTRSQRLITRIVAEWDWRRFKPPVVVAVGDAYHVLDGQHTAIAAATHGSIARIPVLIVEAAEQAERAQAFYSHNRDRIALSALQMFWAAVAAGDEDAQTVAVVAERAGLVILRNPAPQGRFAPGECMAIVALRSLCSRRTALAARHVLEALVKARCAPVSSDLIKAMDRRLNEAPFAGDYAADALAETIIRLGTDLAAEAASIAAIKKIRTWEALAIVLAQKTRKRRGS